MKLSLKNRFVNTPLPLISIFLISLILVVDQMSKNFVQGKFNVVCNRGLVFGLGQNVALVSVIFLLVVLVIMGIEKKRFEVLALSFILGGGIANLADRLFFGCVRDFINFGFWSSFNLADVALTLGVLLISYNLIFKSGKGKSTV